jgi:hypothetical protein
MRRIVIAPTFDREADAIGLAIEERFGEEARRNFVAGLARICTLIGYIPKVGRIRHNTKLSGFVFEQNWIFFDFDDEEVHFLHIVNAKRNMSKLSFCTCITASAPPSARHRSGPVSRAGAVLRPAARR